MSIEHFVTEMGLVDHHCHGVVEQDLDRASFEDLITESDCAAPTGTTFFDTQLGFAIRRHCAPLLDLPAFAEPEEYLERRRDLGGAEVTSRMLHRSGTATYLIETGHRGDQILTPSEMAVRSGSRVLEVVRLEKLLEELASRGIGVSDFRAAYSALLDERLRGAVGVKSIAAYRVGLDFQSARPSTGEVDSAFERWLRQARDRDTELRVEDPTLIRHGIWEAIDRAVPIQVHVGYGDNDVDLHRCNPLLLTDLLRASRGSGADVMLLHCYPYHREAGYLAHVFEHVYCDVGLALNYTGSRSGTVLAESLELTPFHKALYSSDAFGAAELFHLGALFFRRGLLGFMRHSADTDDWPEAEMCRVAQLIGTDNANRVYGLDAA